MGGGVLYMKPRLATSSSVACPCCWNHCTILCPIPASALLTQSTGLRSMLIVLLFGVPCWSICCRCWRYWASWPISVDDVQTVRGAAAVRTRGRGRGGWGVRSAKRGEEQENPAHGEEGKEQAVRALLRFDGSSHVLALGAHRRVVQFIGGSLRYPDGKPSA